LNDFIAPVRFIGLSSSAGNDGATMRYSPVLSNAAGAVIQACIETVLSSPKSADGADQGPKVNVRTKASNSKGVVKRCNTKRVGVTNVFTRRSPAERVTPERGAGCSRTPRGPVFTLGERVWA
jgi:hypothetical protein